jgi:hypothetical protein
VHILDNDDWFIEVGGNAKYAAVGAGKYIGKRLTIHAGVTREWSKFFKKNGVTEFYIGFGFEF